MVFLTPVSGDGDKAVLVLASWTGDDVAAPVAGTGSCEESAGTFSIRFFFSFLFSKHRVLPQQLLGVSTEHADAQFCVFVLITMMIDDIDDECGGDNYDGDDDGILPLDRFHRTRQWSQVDRPSRGHPTTVYRIYCKSMRLSLLISARINKTWLGVASVQNYPACGSNKSRR